jgi:hypothetical protein
MPFNLADDQQAERLRGCGRPLAILLAARPGKDAALLRVVVHFPTSGAIERETRPLWDKR